MDIIVYIFLPPGFSTPVPWLGWCGWSAIHSRNENHILAVLALPYCNMPAEPVREHLSKEWGLSQQRTFYFELSAL